MQVSKIDPINGEKTLIPCEKDPQLSSEENNFITIIHFSSISPKRKVKPIFTPYNS